MGIVINQSIHEIENMKIRRKITKCEDLLLITFLYLLTLCNSLARKINCVNVFLQMQIPNFTHVLQIYRDVIIEY